LSEAAPVAGRWQRALLRLAQAVAVSVPLAAFLLYMRATGENRYVSYSLPVLGEFPNGAVFDLTLLFAVCVLWALVAWTRWTRWLALVALIPAGAFVVLFRVTDHYYYHATRSPFNGYVLYGNLGMVQEGAGVVASAPLGLIITLVVVAHYVAYLAWARYRNSVRAGGRWLATGGRGVFAAIVAVVGVLGLINMHALAVHPQRRYTLTTLAGEYQLLTAIPIFLRERASLTSATATKPARLFLPEHAAAVAPAAAITPATVTPPRRPDIVIVTVESFNALYALPAPELHAGLTEDVMPYFRSLAAEGFQFPHAYTSAAYTFNGIVAVLCSQYTMNEAVWGPGCLPDVLRGNGYEPFSFVSINQLRPYRYDNFRTMGFDRDHVFDAVRVRHGQKNNYFDFLTDKELFDYAAQIADSLVRVPGRKPMFLHLSTNQMHVPGMIGATTCGPYPMPAGVEAPAMTRTLLSAARCTDRDLADLFAKLKRSGVYDDALVVVTADHAFNLSFWDHTESELARIPLFIKFPRSAPRPAIDTAQVVGQVDIAPTILDYLAIAAGRPMYGRSLFLPPDPARTIAGISSSRLMSLASRSGVAFHARGGTDYSATMVRNFKLGDAGNTVRDDASRDALDALFGTVLYFDQHPSEFAATAASAAARRSTRAQTP
jgi:phosphoglycerol transferase MdoB-like AlkP superfamily enzyme